MGLKSHLEPHSWSGVTWQRQGLLQLLLLQAWCWWYWWCYRSFNATRGQGVGGGPNKTYVD